MRRDIACEIEVAERRAAIARRMEVEARVLVGSAERAHSASISELARSEGTLSYLRGALKSQQRRAEARRVAFTGMPVNPHQAIPVPELNAAYERGEITTVEAGAIMDQIRGEE